MAMTGITVSTRGLLSRGVRAARAPSARARFRGQLPLPAPLYRYASQRLRYPEQAVLEFLSARKSGARSKGGAEDSGLAQDEQHEPHEQDRADQPAGRVTPLVTERMNRKYAE